MKKSIHFLFILSFAVSFSGCSKSENKNNISSAISLTEKVKEFLIAANAPKDGLIMIQSQKQAASLIPQNQQVFDGYASGIFYTNKQNIHTATVSKFSIDNFDVPYDGSPAQHVYFIQSNKSQQAFNWMKSLFGKKVKINIQGSAQYRTSVEDSTLYVPQEMIFSANFLTSLSISKSASQTLTWQPDTQNPTGSIFISVIYEAYESNQVNSSMPDTSWVQAFLEVPDNGSYTVTPDKLSGLPTGSVVSIGVVRANYQMLTDPITGTQTLACALSESNTSSSIKVLD